MLRAAGARHRTTMSLIGFHKFLITTAILFSLGFAIRQWSEFRSDGNVWTLMTAIVLAAAAAALGYYLMHLRDILKIPSGGVGFLPSARSHATGPSRNTLWPSESNGESLDDPAVRPGNGHDRSTDWAAPESGPERLPEKDNGHGD